MVAGHLGGEPERELGRQLAGQRAGDHVEGTPGAARIARRQGPQPVIPGDAPVGRVLGGQVRQHGARAGQVTGDDAGPGQRQAGFRGLRHRLRRALVTGDGGAQHGGPLLGVQRAQRGQVPGGRVGGVHLGHRERGDDLRGRRRWLGRRGPVGRGPVRHRAGHPGRLQFRAEQRGERGPWPAVRHREHLAQHPGELVGHLPRRREPALRVRVGGAQQRPVERLLLGEQRNRPRVRQAVGELALVAGELEGHHGQRAADRVQIGGHRGAQRCDLRCLVADGPVDRAVVVIDAVHAAHVDDLELFLGLNDVVRLEVAVHQPPAVQVAQRRQDLDRVRERDRQGQRLSALAALLQNLPQGFTAHIFHNDVARGLSALAISVLHEVVNADDARVLDLSEEPALGDGRLLCRCVAGVEQALEHHPSLAEVVVHGQVDPAEPAVGEAAQHFVLAGHHLAGH